MENFAITVKRKIILQNAVTSKKLTMFNKYQDSSKSDENSKIFENEALFIGSVSCEDFTAFDNDHSIWTADLEVK